MENLGFRVFPVEEKLDESLVHQFKSVVTPHISDNMNRIQSLGAEIRPYHSAGKLVGTAVTVKTRPGDNLMVHKAIDMAGKNHVIVVDAGGDVTNAIVGEIMMRLSQKKGIAGFIINGAIRDTGAFQNDSFPVYAKGVTHRGPYKDGPGEINVPISINGTIINPGDLLVGDEDGVAVVPAEVAEEVLELVLIQQEKEADIFRSIENGSIDRSWVDETLQQRGCEMVGNTQKI